MLHLYTYFESMLVSAKRRQDERGATAVEYGLLVGLIAVAIIATLLLLGPKLNTLFDKVLTSLPTV